MSAGFSVALLRDSLTRLGVELAAARVCVAFSGGVDSTALMIGMRELRRAEPSMQVRAIHVNHHLLAQADAWGRHCQSIAQELDVPFGILDANVVTGSGISTEAAARDARYALFEEQLQE